MRTTWKPLTFLLSLFLSFNCLTGSSFGGFLKDLSKNKQDKTKMLLAHITTFTHTHGPGEEHLGVVDPQDELLREKERLALCSKKFPKEKNMITVKGFYIGMNVCDAKKIIKEGKYKSVFAKAKNGIRIHENGGRVTKIHFKKNLLQELFKSKDMSLKMFAENFGKHYIEGKFMFEMEPYNDVKNNNYGYEYYNGEVGYKFFIKQNESGTGVESLTIEEVAKVSEGFGD